MKIKSMGLALSVLASAVPAFAADRVVSPLKSADYEKLSVADLSAGDIKYTQNIETWDGWTSKYGEASKLLALYPGYKEGTIWSSKDGVVTSKAEPLVFYVARTKTVLNRASTAIDLKSLLKYANIQALVPEMRFAPAPIGNDQLVASYVHNKKPVASFEWCNKPDVFISRQHREVNLDEMMPPASAREPWCSRTDRSTCFEACVPLMQGPTKFFFDTAMAAFGPDEKKDPGQALQAEVRYLVTEAEGGFAKGSFDGLTKVGTPVSGIVELNMFYMNQIIQYGKMVTVLQPDPSDANKTIMTNFVVMGVKSHSWFNSRKFVKDEIQNFLLGKGSLNKGQKGLMGGVPRFTQDLTQHLVEMLESAKGS